MPSAVPSCGSFTFQPRTCSKENRYSSTGQGLNTAHDDERMAAMLHGKERNQGERIASKRPPLEHAPVQPSLGSPQSAALSRRVRKKPNHWAERGSMKKKRERAAAEVQSEQAAIAAKLQRSNAPKLKDEAYIRSTRRMPTPQDYPSLPQNVFEAPKRSILAVAHGAQLAECRSEIVALAKDAYQCTVHYKSAMHNEAVVGEGRTKASRSILCDEVC